MSHIKKIHDTANEYQNAVKKLGVEDPHVGLSHSAHFDTQTHNDYIDSVK